MGPVDYDRFEDSQNAQLCAVIYQLVEIYRREREKRIELQFETQKNGEEAIKQESLRGLCKQCSADLEAN